MLLAFDLDNTVVTRDRVLPAEIQRAIFAARTAGHAVTVLTGRPPASALEFVERLEVAPGPYAVNHGALVYGRGGEVLKHRRLRGDEVRAAIGLAMAGQACSFAVIEGEVLHVNDARDPRWAWAHTNNREVRVADLDAITVADKIVIASDDAGARMDAAVRSELTLTSYLWDDGFLEFTAPDADKGAALALIATELGVPRDDVVAFGDGMNDVSMLSWAGRSVSVGPYAPNAVRDVADEHIDAPESLGVAGWLERMLEDH